MTRILSLVSVLALPGLFASPAGATQQGGGVDAGAAGAGYSITIDEDGDIPRFIAATGQRTGVLNPAGNGLLIVYRCEAAAGVDSASVVFPAPGNPQGDPIGCRVERQIQDPNRNDPEDTIWQVAHSANGFAGPGPASTTGTVPLDEIALGGALAFRVCWFSYAVYILDAERRETAGCSDAGVIPDDPPRLVSDVAVSLVGGGWFFIGEEFTYTATVSTDIHPASSVGLLSVTPADVEIVDVIPSQGSCSWEEHVVSCDLGHMEAHSTVEVAIRLMPLSGGVLSNHAMASSSGIDTNPADNLASETTPQCGLC